MGIFKEILDISAMFAGLCFIIYIIINVWMAYCATKDDADIK